MPHPPSPPHRSLMEGGCTPDVLTFTCFEPDSQGLFRVFGGCGGEGMDSKQEIRISLGHGLSFSHFISFSELAVVWARASAYRGSWKKEINF